MAGIYIHIPFCKQACHYCNFHFSTSLAQKEKMLVAIVKEINTSPSLEEKGEMKAEARQNKENISTLYFGGGTPSILTIGDLRLIFQSLHDRFEFAEGIEITLEANPDDINEQQLIDWRSLGINRLSIGIQSFSEEELTWMNRAHTAAESLACIELVRKNGFTNFSVDLIYGSPLLSDEDWKKNVDIIINKNIPHISCYALTVEPRTALDKMIALKKKEPVDPEKQARQFLLLMEWMEQAGYEHYEISNFAKPGFRSRHNSSYWQGEPYYAFGPAAHAFDGKKRKWNIANNSLYIQSLQQNMIPFEEELLTETQQLNEYIMTSLRTMEGLDLEQVSKNFGIEKVNVIRTAATKYLSSGRLKQNDQKLILTKEGKLFADGIAADLFF
ncbi:MAG TPA: radical SAM family heme chaperone HemW [Ferruginibacter sp.]|nr:radical SAM family heme chaperone HemW [Ferruginibacter sp.]